MATSVDLQKRVERLYDHLYANSPVKTPEQICKEVGKLLHAGIYEEEINGVIPAFSFAENELDGLLFSTKEFRTEVAEKVRTSFKVMNQSWKLYTPSGGILLSDSDICYTCGELATISLSDKHRDVFGDALEIFRTQCAKRMGGQFFTDQRVTALAMALLEFDPRKGHDLVDICAGTGGFLLAGLNRIRELLEENESSRSVESKLIGLARKSLKGQEVDAQVAYAANATLSSRLGSQEVVVQSGDSLDPKAFAGRDSAISEGAHLAAASNPPFGAEITIKDADILSHYDLARPLEKKKSSAKQDTLVPRPPDILFLERNIKLLKKGKGRLAIVLPYQLLSGPKTLFVREYLLRHTRLLSVVDLPPETFQPHTGTKTSLVVIERRKKPMVELSDGDSPVFMSMPRWIGHDRRGHPVYRRSPDGKVTDEILCDLDDVSKAWDHFRQGENPAQTHGLSFQTTLQGIYRDPLLRINALFNQPAEAESKQTKKIKKTNIREEVKLKTLVERIFYPGRFKRNYVDYVDGAVPFFGGSNITDFIARKEKWLSPDDPKLEQLRVETGWLLITRSGSTGIISRVPEAWSGFAMSEHVIRIVPDESKISPYFLLTFLRSKYAQDQLSRGVYGSVIDEITPEYVGELIVPIPRSKKVMEELEKSVRDAEEARDKGIRNHAKASERFNKLLRG